MTYVIVTTQTYRKALKKLARSGSFSLRGLEVVLLLLKSGAPLPAKYRDHALTGDLGGYRECHIQSDLLLMYTKDGETLVLVLINIGSHAHLFNK